MRHEVLAVLELSALLEEAFFLGHLLLLIFHGHLLVLVVPVNLEFGDTGLLRQDVPVQAVDVDHGGRVLIQLGIVVLDVAVVADS